MKTEHTSTYANQKRAMILNDNTEISAVIDKDIAWGIDCSVGELLALRAAQFKHHIYIKTETENWTLQQIKEAVDRVCRGLTGLGIKPNDKIGVMLPNSVEHIICFYALATFGICQVPINVQQRGPGLRHVLEHSEIKAIIADLNYQSELEQVNIDSLVPIQIWVAPASSPIHGIRLGDLLNTNGNQPITPDSDQNRVFAILYTSGTTGTSKGVLFTDKMMRVAGMGTVLVCRPKPGDTYFFWEPIYHVAGNEVVMGALLYPTALGMVPRFSVSKFWSQARALGATHIHYNGGVLGMLLKSTPQPTDSNNDVRIAWGGGCPLHLLHEFENRFKLKVVECYGLTEASSFTSANIDGPAGSNGRPFSFNEVKIMDSEDNFVKPNEPGEIVIRELQEGVLMKGYFRDPETTKKTLRNGYLHTGDIGRLDENGFLYFMGRAKDTIRRRGENIIAVEIERAVNGHSSVVESAAIAVPNDIGDVDIKIFVRPAQQNFDPQELMSWCRERMPRFQIPRYICLIDEFPRTPTQRVRKELLSRSVDDCWDMEKQTN